MLEKIKKWRPSPVNLLLIGLIIYVWFRPPAWVTDEARAAPEFAVTTMSGEMLTMSELRGKVVLVNFWATWCPYCRHEMPDMERFYNDYKAKGFEIVALSLDDDPMAVYRFMKQEKYGFPAAMSTGHINAQFGDVTKLPTSFVVDKNGQIRKKVSGQVHYGRLEDLVLPLLKE